MSPFEYAASTIALLALITAGVSLWLTVRGGSFHELRTQVRQIDLDLHELFDTVEKWTRRDRVRRLREGREAAGAEQASLPAVATLADHKAALRRRIST